MSAVIDLCSDDDEIVASHPVSGGRKCRSVGGDVGMTNGGGIAVPDNVAEVDDGIVDDDGVACTSTAAAGNGDGPPNQPVSHVLQRALLGPKDTSQNDARVRQLRTQLTEVGNLICEYEALLADAQERHKALESELNKRVRKLREEADATFDWLAPMPWDVHLWHELETVFHIKQFRPLQREALNATLMRRDVFAVLPTGAGKSLIYQLAAVVDAGLTVVIAPLISLSQDQQLELSKLGITAVALDSTTPSEVSSRIFREILPHSGRIPNSNDPRKPHNMFVRAREIKRMRKLRNKRARDGQGNQHAEIMDEDGNNGGTNGGKGAQACGPVGWVRDDMKTAILFVTPEQVVKSKRLMSRLESLYESGHLSRICVDEAHCCSFWGHDFRADYRKLGILRRQCPDVPILALSATCSPETAADVAQILEMRQSVTFRGSVDRANLFYEVRLKPDSDSELVSELAAILISELRNQIGIVYVLSRKEAETYAAQLKELGVSAECYHGDLGRDERTAVHENWGKGRVTVVIATVAFGLGINNPNTRFVIHLTMSTSLEGYYQESGRCGRDGRPGRCILFTRPKDFTRLSAFISDKGNDRVKKLYEMYKYATGRCLSAYEGAGGASGGYDRYGQVGHLKSLSWGSDEKRREFCRRAILTRAFNEEPPVRVFSHEKEKRRRQPRTNNPNSADGKDDHVEEVDDEDGACAGLNLVRDCCDMCRRRGDKHDGVQQVTSTSLSTPTPTTAAHDAAVQTRDLVLVDVSKVAASVTRIMLGMQVRRPDEKLTMLALATNWGTNGAKAKRMRGDEDMLDRNVSLDTRLEILIELVLLEGLAELFRHSSYTVNAYIIAGRRAEQYAFAGEDGESSRVILTVTKIAAWELCNFAGCHIVEREDEMDVAVSKQYASRNVQGENKGDGEEDGDGDEDDEDNQPLSERIHALHHDEDVERPCKKQKSEVLE